MTVRSTTSWPAVKLRNRDRVYADLAAGRVELRGLPPVVGLHTTEICNLRCVMCERNVVVGKRRLDRTALQRVADEVFPTAFKAYVSGSNGEPMLADFDIVRDGALRHGVKLDLATNGTALTVDRYREMRDALARINVSLDAHVPAVYERIRVGGKFSVVLANLHAIAEERRRHPDGVVLDISALLMRSNADIMPDMVRFAADLGVDHMHIQMLRHFGRPLPDEELDPDVKQRVRRDRGGGRAAKRSVVALSEAVGDRLDEIALAARESLMNVTFGDFGRPPVVHRVVPNKLDGLEPPPGFCWSLGLNFSVQPDGSVYPCCHPTDYRLGNIVDTSAAEIWNGPVAQKLRAAHYEKRRVGFCTGCIEAPYLGDARASSLSAWGARMRLAAAHFGLSL